VVRTGVAKLLRYDALLMERFPSTLLPLGRYVVDALPTAAQKRVRKWAGRPGPRRVSLDGLDAELSEAARLFASSEDQARSFLQSFELAPPGGRPPDPFSTEYREWAWNLYHLISGQLEYTTANETSPFDLAGAMVRPFPFATGSATVVGGDLVARGHLMRCIGDESFGLTSPGRIVEFGPGWGNLTMDLVATGFDVTAVEVDEKFCTLIQKRCAFPENLTVVPGDMLAFDATTPYDAAVFFESFHHCSDHLAMLRKLHEIVRPGGPVFFASEPVQKMDYPWGPRLDGLSVWSTRSHGWLELGFDADYFDDALHRTGWRGRRRLAGGRMGAADVIVAVPDPEWRS
jgi:SAM-dependent methyltransferase